MNNPLMGGVPQVNGMNNIQQFMQQFQQFRQSFRGNPQEQIQQLMNSGKVNQSQYNAAYQRAQEFMRMMGGNR